MGLEDVGGGGKEGKKGKKEETSLEWVGGREKPNKSEILRLRGKGNSKKNSERKAKKKGW